MLGPDLALQAFSRSKSCTAYHLSSWLIPVVGFDLKWETHMPVWQLSPYTKRKLRGDPDRAEAIWT
jgi:hypothetical protein